MPIEFPCSQCGKLLTIEDKFAGKQAMCPLCRFVQDVPIPPAAEPAAPFGEMGVGFNPYVSPTSPTYLAAPRSPFATAQPLDLGDVLSRAFEVFKNQLLMAIVGTILMQAAASTIMVIPMLPLLIVVGVAQAGGASPAVLAVAFLGFYVMTIAIMMIAMAWVKAGLIGYFLKLVRGESVEFTDLFRGGPFILPLLIAELLRGLAIYAGLILCVAPGILVAILFSQVAFLIVDRRMGVFESFGASIRMTEGNRLNLLLTWLAVWGIAMLAGCVPLAGIFVAPFIELVAAVAYLIQSGEPTAGVVRVYADRLA